MNERRRRRMKEKNWVDSDRQNDQTNVKESSCVHLISIFVFEWVTLTRSPCSALFYYNVDACSWNLHWSCVLKHFDFFLYIDIFAISHLIFFHIQHLHKFIHFIWVLSNIKWKFKSFFFLQNFQSIEIPLSS